MLSGLELLQEGDLQPTNSYSVSYFSGVSSWGLADIGAFGDSATLLGDIAQMDTKRLEEERLHGGGTVAQGVGTGGCSEGYESGSSYLARKEDQGLR